MNAAALAPEPPESCTRLSVAPVAANDTIPVPPPADMPHALSPDEAIALAGGLATALARSFARRGGSFDDLLQEAYVVILAAADRWSPDGGASFTSFVFHPIRTALKNMTNRERRRGFVNKGGKGRAACVVLGRTVSMDEPGRTDERTLHDLVGAPATQEAALHQERCLAKIRDAVARLPEDDRQLWERASADVVSSSDRERSRLRKIAEEILSYVEGRAAVDRRRQSLISHDGREMSIAAWSREVGIPASRIYKRLKTGWTVSDALTSPVDAAKRTHGKAAA